MIHLADFGDSTSALAALAKVAPPSSPCGALFLHLVEVATVQVLDALGDVDAEMADYHLHADVWPAVDRVLGDRTTDEAFAVALDLSLVGADNTTDGLGRVAFNLCSALTAQRWVA